MNKGLARASGDFVYFLNAGDVLMSPTVIGEVAAFLAGHPDADVVYGSICVVAEDGERAVHVPVPPEVALEFLVFGCLPHQGTFAKRTVFELTGGFDEAYAICADHDWFLKVLCDPNLCVHRMPVTVAAYRLGGLSSRILESHVERCAIENRLPLYRTQEWRHRRLVSYQQQVLTLRLENAALKARAPAAGGAGGGSGGCAGGGGQPTGGKALWRHLRGVPRRLARTLRLRDLVAGGLDRLGYALVPKAVLACRQIAVDAGLPGRSEARAHSHRPGSDDTVQGPGWRVQDGGSGDEAAAGAPGRRGRGPSAAGPEETAPPVESDEWAPIAGGAGEGVLPAEFVPRRVLLSRFDTFGDIVLLTGLLAALKELWPQAKIHLLVRDRYGELATLVPTVLGLHWRMVATAPLQGAPKDVLPADLTAVIDEPWDLFLMTAYTTTWRDERVLCMLAGRGVRCVRIAGPTAPALDGVATVAVAELSHETAKYRHLFAALCRRTAGEAPALSLPSPRLTVPAEATAQATALLAGWGVAPGAYVICQPGGIQNIPGKAWPADNFGACIAHLAGRPALATILCGHISEEGVVRAAGAAAKALGATPYVWLGRDGELAVLSALLSMSRLYLGNDTGPMHIAQALGVPAVSIFAGGQWPRFAPTGAGITCFSGWPCVGCDWNCPFETMPCVRSVTVAGVVRAIDRVIADPTLRLHLDFPCRDQLMERLWRRPPGSAGASGPSASDDRPQAGAVPSMSLTARLKGAVLHQAARLGYTVIHSRQLAQERAASLQLRRQLEAVLAAGAEAGAGTGEAIRRAAPVQDPLPIHFFTIVLNGEPFIRHHVQEFARLPFRWHWHIIEGVADLCHDTAWSVALGGRIRPTLHDHGRSNDGTSAYLDALVDRYPHAITLYRKPPDVFWDGKREMVGAPLANIQETCLLWQVDADELWTATQIERMRALFLAQPSRTAAYFWCHFFTGARAVITTRYGYGGNGTSEWLRVWRFHPGAGWERHEPPVLAEVGPDGGMRNVAALDPFTHAETEAEGLVFQHMAYATEAQVRFKESYYGYAGAVGHWRRLQAAATKPVILRDFLPWVKDGAMADDCGRYGIVPLAHPTPDRTGWAFLNTDEHGHGVASPLPASPLSPPLISRPRILVDGVCFQTGAAATAALWEAILRAWSTTAFCDHLVLLDRGGTAPRIPGLPTRSIALFDPDSDADSAASDAPDAADSDRAGLAGVCATLGADLLLSSGTTAPGRTPTVVFLNDRAGAGPALRRASQVVVLSPELATALTATSVVPPSRLRTLTAPDAPDAAALAIALQDLLVTAADATALPPAADDQPSVSPGPPKGAPGPSGSNADDQEIVIRRLRARANELEQTIRAMEASPFWRLRGVVLRWLRRSGS